jgi:hypothetical protein
MYFLILERMLLVLLLLVVLARPQLGLLQLVALLVISQILWMDFTIEHTFLDH